MFVVSVRERGKEEHRFTFRKQEVIVGRLRASDIILPKRNISKKHARLVLSDGNKILLEDLGSTNGSYINGKKVLELTPVGEEDKVFMGDYILQIKLMGDKSVAEGEMAGGSVGEPEGLQKATVADLEAEQFQHELQNMPGEAAGPSTVVLDPLAVPASPPADLGDSLDVGDLAPPDAPQESDTMRFHSASKAEPAPAAAAEEELLDIDLLEEQAGPAPGPPVESSSPAPSFEEIGEVKPLSTESELEEFRADVKMPGRTDRHLRPVPQAAVPFVPSASRLEVGTTALLESRYDAFAAEYETWARTQGGNVAREQAVRKLATMLASGLGAAVSAQEVETLAGQMFSELTDLGIVGSMLQDPRVGEVYAGTSGRLLTFDWRGEVIDSSSALSCPAAVRRMTERLAGKHADKVVTLHLAGGVVLRILREGNGGGTAMRFVRPFQTTISLGKLQDTGVASKELAARMRKSVDAGRRIIVAGRQAQINSLVLHSLASGIPTDRKVLVCGDRFAPPLHLDHRTRFDAAMLEDPISLRKLVAGLDFNWVVVEGATCSSMSTLLRLSMETQTPFLASAKLDGPSGIVGLLSGPKFEERSEQLAMVDVLAPIIVLTERGSDGVVRVEGVYLFTLDGGRPKMVPQVN